MITITSSEAVTIRVRLNQSNVTGTAITLQLNSPSRPSLSFDSVITTLSPGYYTFPLNSSDTSQLVDDTYLYTIAQSSKILKVGEVRFIKTDSSITQFDYTLDFALA